MWNPNMDNSPSLVYSEVTGGLSGNLSYYLFYRKIVVLINTHTQNNDVIL